MRRPLLIILLSLLCFALPVSAADRGALFKVAAHGHTMYLFGTIHVGLPDFYPLEPRIAAAVAGASTLALEINPLMDPAIMAAAMQAHGMFEPGSAANRQMPPTLKKRLARVLAQRRIEPSTVAAFKPWLVATMLALGEYAEQGFRPELSVDLHLAQIAGRSKVPVIELESVNAQLGLFSRLSHAEQWRFLEESLELIETGKQGKQVQQIAAAWSTADKTGLDQIAARAASDTSVSGKFVQEVMLDERNAVLAVKLDQLLAREDNSVAAIGVLHLLGKNSVPALLRAKGVAVERVY